MPSSQTHNPPPTNGVLRLYSLLLALFPLRFRDEFGAEMQAVFAQALSDAAESSALAVLALVLREARDLPRLALRERWRERKRSPYVSPTPALPAVAPPSTREERAALALFVIPALMVLVGALLPATTAGLLAMALAAAAVSAGLYGVYRGLPRWALPFTGLLAGLAGVYGIYPPALAALGPLLGPLSTRLEASGRLAGGLAWQLIHAGIVWGCILLAAAAFLALAAHAPWLRSAVDRLRADWSQISFLLYGALLALIRLDIDGDLYAAPYLAGVLPALAAGAWGFLRARSRARRVLALLAGSGVAMVILGAGKYFLVPLPEWPGWPAGYAAAGAPGFEALRAAAFWFWTAAALLGPGLIHRRPPVWLANLALCLLWLVLFRPVYPYLQIIFSRQEFRLNQIALAGVIGLLVYQARRHELNLRFGAPPALHRPALAMLLGSSALFIFAERVVDINTLSASLFGLALYGLLGLWLEPRRWRQGLPAALLLIGTLPFGEHLQTFVGYPVRLLTAVLVRDGLAAFGVPSIGIDTILVFENGISQIDLPCSGVKSFWTGGMFLLAATWIEGRGFNRRWLISGLVFAFLLFAANLARVAILITVGQVFQWRLLAEMLHVPLGVLGFGAACLALVGMLRRYVPASQAGMAEQPAGAAPGAPVTPRWLSPALFAAIFVLAALYTPRPQVAAAQAPHPVAFSGNLAAEPWPFTPGELAWLSADGPLSASRWRFAYRDYRGSVLLITSDTWRAHHRPERCFEAYGLTVNQSRSLLVSDDFPIRQLTLSAGKSSYRATAVYWLQSPQRITDDYATRIWSDLAPQRQTWVLVTVLFDTQVEPLDADLQDLYAGLEQSVARSLESGGLQ